MGLALSILRRRRHILQLTPTLISYIDYIHCIQLNHAVHASWKKGTVSFSTLPPQQFSEEVTRHGHSNPTRTSSISSLKAQSSAFVSPLRSSSSNSSFKSQASTPSPGASNRMHGENRGNRSPAGSSHNGSPAGRALSTPELTPPQPDKAAQPKRFYTWQLGKGKKREHMCVCARNVRVLMCVHTCWYVLVGVGTCWYACDCTRVPIPFENGGFSNPDSK